MFFGKTNLKLIEKQEKLLARGSGGMLPWKKFENLDAVMAVLVLFALFSGKFCLNFLTLILSALTDMMQFVHTFSIMRA